jgi:hypothetical protein
LIEILSINRLIDKFLLIDGVGKNPISSGRDVVDEVKLNRTGQAAQRQDQAIQHPSQIRKDAHHSMLPLGVSFG